MIFDQFDNDDALINILELYEVITIDDHKEEIYPKFNTLAYFGESTPSSRWKTRNKGKNEKNKSLGENRKVSLDHEREKDKNIPRIQNEQADAMNISFLVFNIPQSLFLSILKLSQSTFMWEVVGLNPPISSLYPTIYAQILLCNLSNTQNQTSI